MITEKYIKFFKGLEENNNKEWFHEHKKQYENDAKKPFLELLEVLIPELLNLDPEISNNPKDALFRINRDIRFSKDKTPYNTLLKAGFASGGKKSVLPGFYLGISSKKIHVGGGLFGLSTDTLKKVRQSIYNSPEEFNDIINGPSFKKKFSTLKGEQAKRLDKTFKEIQQDVPYIANKQFYAMQELDLEKHINSNQLPSIIFEYFKEINTLNTFLKQAF